MQRGTSGFLDEDQPLATEDNGKTVHEQVNYAMLKNLIRDFVKISKKGHHREHSEVQEGGEIEVRIENISERVRIIEDKMDRIIEENIKMHKNIIKELRKSKK
jgi:hypothetical protein